MTGLRTARDIRERRAPTLVQHEAERLCGWPGSDGSSNSPDTIWGMRIGRTSPDFMPDLPTYVHDLEYRAIRRLLALGEISEEEAEELRECGDETLLLGLVHKAAGGSVLLRGARWRRSLTYYEGVRLFGSRSVVPRDGESYPRLPGPRAA